MGAPEKEVRGLKKFFRRNSKNGSSHCESDAAVDLTSGGVSGGDDGGVGSAVKFVEIVQPQCQSNDKNDVTAAAFSVKTKRTSIMNILKTTKAALQPSQQQKSSIIKIGVSSNSSTYPNSNSSGGSSSGIQKGNDPPTIILPHTPAAGRGSEPLPQLHHRIWTDGEEQNIPSFPPDHMQMKQMIKERDGFCRRVDLYDGHVLHVDGFAAYELGNYLGGGVAGVVYEGHRLRPMEDYPVRLGRHDVLQGQFINSAPIRSSGSLLNNGDVIVSVPTPIDNIHFLCGESGNAKGLINEVGDYQQDRVTSLLTLDEEMTHSALSVSLPGPHNTAASAPDENVLALEATASQDNTIMIDTVDAPSRSKHFAHAIVMNVDTEYPSDASFTNGIMEETVAIKVLNPVGFRTISPEVFKAAVVARKGDSLDVQIVKGLKPMEERHVWWLINPNSRNLRTLQRYSVDQVASRRVQVDRGTPEKGLRISLIAAYHDDVTNEFKELPLTRCIEIWGHVPFGATDTEFKQIMNAIDRINQGLPPPPIPSFERYHQHLNGQQFPNNNGGRVPGRIGTGGTDSTASVGSLSMEDYPVVVKRTGIHRAASSQRKTVFCSELQAYIALPAVPSKYLKWLRQRRAATKEIRNMMHIGRHHNVVHLFEVLEYIQENKSTMFLILELVRGGELFDLISTNAAKITSNDRIPPGFTESETVMRKFFRELASGVHYCHANGIAHRDLKPENLLVHNGRDGHCTLKIADFGLSAAFGPNSELQTDVDTVVESLAPGGSAIVAATNRDESSSFSLSPAPSSLPIKERFDRLFSASGNAFSSFLSCGVMEDILNCQPTVTDVESGGPTAPLRRMTSVVGSPHYVAPEIISQTDIKRSKNKDSSSSIAPVTVGYDGTKADVWSAGVILYAMLFRSLPFGEDLLRCPRYQSFKKWYDDAKKAGGSRRSSPTAALNTVITEVDQREYLGPHWFFPSQSSAESRDLIVYMLNPDPDMRPSIQMVLQHPWLLKQAL